MSKHKSTNFSLVTPLPTVLRLDVWPFALLYGLLIYQFSQLEEDNIYLKLVMIAVCFIHCLVFIFGHWSKKFRSRVQYRVLKGNFDQNLEKASHVHVMQKKEGQNPVHDIIDFFKEEGENGQVLYFFHFEQRKYFYNREKGTFERMKPKFKNCTLKDIYRHAVDAESKKIYEFYDPNILQIPIRPFWDIVRDHFMNPFSFFQLFSVFLWMLDDNRAFSIMIIIMLFFSAFTIAIQRIKTLVSFRSMSLAPHYVYVYRHSKWEKIPSYELKPMDVVVVEPGYKCKKLQQERMTDSEFLAKCIPFSKNLPAGFLKTEENNVASEKSVPCDMLLLTGSCIANESILTGESIPQIKDSAEYLKENEIFNINKSKQCVLFCGTEILQTSTENMDYRSCPIQIKSAPPAQGCLALVLRTGYDTSKGKLIRTVLSNTQNLNIRQKDGLYVILFLLVCSIITSIYVLNVGLEDEDRNKNKLFLRCILIITTVVPPELPMILTLAVNNSILYLQRKRIYVTEPQRIPEGGKVNIIAFDKTGTLTSDKFTFEGIVDDLSNYQELKKIEQATPAAQAVLAGCHTLINVEGKLTGDPIELLFFQSSNWEYSSHNKEAFKKRAAIERVEIKHIYPFRSDLKRMSTEAVHIDEKGRHKVVLTKGAPEIIEKLLTKVPQNYTKAYTHFTSQGFRVLALASKSYVLDQQSQLSKDQLRNRLETNLNFVGFFICNSPLKDDTLKNIQRLQRAQYRLIMITGDNLFTAATVGKQLGFGKDLVIVEREGDLLTVEIDQAKVKVKDLKDFKNLIGKSALVCTSTVSHLPPEFLPYIAIFARTSPSEKEYIVTKLKEIVKQQILYAGDGTNDVGGLRAADVGIAVVGLSKLSDIQEKEQKIKQKEEDHRKKLKEIERDMTLPFGKRIEKMQKAMREGQQNRMLDLSDLSSEIKFGDACIAAPFTSKHSNSIYCVLIVIRQAISTLVTTIQTYKILGITSLLQAYSLAEMNMVNLKYSQNQTLVMGILGAINFYFFSNAKPMKQISHVRAPSTIFNFWFLLSLFGQVTIYLAGNYYALNHIGMRYLPEEDKNVSADAEFAPSFVNTVIFLFTAISQSLVFLINHGGEPHIESLMKNKKYFRFLIIPMIFCFVMAADMIPSLSSYLNLKFDKVPYEANIEMLKTFGLMVFSSYTLERICKYGQFKSFFGWV